MCALLLAFNAWAQSRPAPPIPQYEVKRSTSPLVIDGKTDDKAWASANAVELGVNWDSQTGVKQKTVARLLWDDENLYLSYECEDADITAQFLQRDDPTYRDDTVEVFLNPRPAQTNVYIGLEMNVRAVLYDYLSTAVGESRAVFKRFNLDGAKLATHIDGTLNMTGDKDGGWSLEVSVPWVNFQELGKPPKPGDTWAFNMSRWDGVEPSRRFSIWSDPLLPRPGPHEPRRFGQLRFVP
jgi:hypothetical protein